MTGWRFVLRAASGRKAEAVARLTVQQQLAYKTDFLLRSSFLLLILFVFVQLWTAAYGGDSAKVISGFTMKEIIWYLVFTESLTMAAPPLTAKVEEEVKSGDIAVRLIRPMSYLGYHYSAFLSEAAFRCAVHLLVGSAVAWSFVGAPDFGFGWPGFMALSLGALTVAFLLNASVALCAFWVEETAGLQFVLQKLQFTIGGMLLPVDLMPGWLQRVCAWLPFQAALYLPARAAVHYDGAMLLRFAAVQIGWIAVLGALVAFMYRRGVRKLYVNGG
ncbi:ABC transporter permease [Cohnella thermotolerans]|uniref:ABC transporter permease n=1 Tax=Cohnella thermotolerans TaxID=329858 RepID=UPI000400638C|nr:ABC-2 family transporter protein [Cohnella thermotolerans]